MAGHKKHSLATAPVDTGPAEPVDPNAAPLFSEQAPLFNAPTAPLDAGVTLDGAPPPSATATPQLPMSGKKVVVLNEEGFHRMVDAAYLPAAMKEGWRPETAEEEAARKYIKDHPTSGPIALAMRKWVNASLLGVPGAVESGAGKDIAAPLLAAIPGMAPAAAAYAWLKGGLVTDYDAAKEAQIEKTWKAAAYTGEAAGIVNSLFLPVGKVGVVAWKGATALERRILTGGVEATVEAGLTRAAPEIAAKAPTLARKLAEGSIKGLAEGAALSAPQALTELSLGDPKHAGETFVYTTLGGGTIGLLGHMVGAAAKPIAAKIKNVGGASAAAEDQAVKSLGMTKPYNDKLVDLNLDGIEKRGVVGAKNPAGRIAIDAGLNIVATPAEKYELATQAMGEAREAITKRWDAVAGAGAVGDGLKLVEDIKAVATGLEKNPELQPYAKNVVAYAERLESHIKSISSDRLALAGEEVPQYGAITPRELKDRLDSLFEMTRRGGDEAPHRFELRKIESIFMNAMDDTMEAAAKKAGLGADFVPGWKLDKFKYRVLDTIAEGLENNLGRNISNIHYGLTSRIAGMVGAGVGHTVGGIPGAVLGHIGSMEGRRLASAHGNAVLSQIADRLGGGSQSGLAIVEKSIATTAKELDKIPTFLESFGNSETAESELVPAKVFAHFLGKKTGGDKKTEFFNVSKEIMRFVTDQNHLQTAIENTVAPIAKDAPLTAQMAGAQMASAIAFLHTAMPKDPRPLRPFQKAGDWEPTDKQYSDFAKQLRVIQDPMSLLKRGRASQLELETLKANWPNVYEEVVRRVATLGFQPDGPKLSYNHLLRLSKMLDKPLLKSQELVSEYQATVKKSAEPPKKPGSGPKIKVAESLTEPQKISFK